MKRDFDNIISILTKREKQKFFSLMLLSLGISIADIISIAFLFFVVNFYSRLHSINIPFLSQWDIKEDSILPALLLIIIFTCKSVASYYFYKSQFRYVYNVASRLSAKNLLLYLEGSYWDHVHEDSALFIRKIRHQPIEFAHYVLAGVQQMITEIILILLTITALLIIDARLVIIISLVLLPAIAVLRYITKKRLSVIRNNIKPASEKSIQHLNEALRGFIESNIYHKNEFFTERYTDHQKKLNTYLADLQIAQGAPSRFFELFAIFGLFILIAAGQYAGAEKVTSLFTLGAFIAAAYRIIPGTSKIINLSSQVKTYEYTVNELLKTLHVFPANKTSSEDRLDAIEFCNVQFSYNSTPVLTGFNIVITKGSFLGITGISGKGKTTLINLLLGFLSPQKGSIFFNGKAVDAAERKSFWNKIAYVKQGTFMLHDSILNNITLYAQDANVEKLDCIIEATGLKTFIEQFSEGIEKIITEDGRNISGGQRQRIAIARALYKDADTIILDEPFNELDEQSELAMLNYFRKLSGTGKIVILITHNTNSLSFCNRVINLHE